MNKLTEYKAIHDGYCEWLYYKKKLFFFSIWVRVPKPYYDKVMGRSDIMGWNTCYTSYDGKLDNFIKAWTNIEDYLKEYQRRQTLLEKAAAEYRKQFKERQGERRLT